MVVSVHLSIAQDDDYTYGKNYMYHSFEEGQECKLVADNVNVRSAASTKGDILANIPIGTDLKILQQSEKTLRLKGFTSNWYKVSFENKGKTQSGYVWGGLIADVWISSKIDNDLIFLFGAERFKKIEHEGGWIEEKITAQMRACKKNKELSKLSFDLGGGLNVSRWIGSLGDKSVSGVKEVLSAGASQDMCAGYYGENIVFWDG